VRSKTRRILLIPLWVAIVAVVSIFQIIPLPYAPISTTFSATAILLGGYYVSDKILDRLTGGEKQDPKRFLDHYHELRDNAFVKWRDARVKFSPIGDLQFATVATEAPVYLILDLEGEIGTAYQARAWRHLRDEKYKGRTEGYGECKKLMSEQNLKMWDIVKKIEIDVTLMLLRYPMLHEIGSGSKTYYMRRSIIRAIENSEEIAITGDGILADDNQVAHIEDADLVKQFFMGDVASLVEKYRPTLEEFRQYELFSDVKYQPFRSFMGELVQSITSYGKLEGECDIEQQRTY
jgi:hypothetical protein